MSLAEVSAAQIDIGRVEDYERLPARVRIGHIAYYLTRADAGWQLLSSVCPHMGGEIEDCGDIFRCPNHGWSYDRARGVSTNVPGQRMAVYSVQERDGRLLALLPPDAGIRSNVERLRRTVSGVSIELLAHACLEISHGDFSLLTDPWLFGPAFMGAWAHYPPSPRGRSVRPDGLWISHEHSDHFHEPTLREFDRLTPVYVPDFPNRRLPERLDKLGFTEVTAMPFGERVTIAEDFHITCFEPQSLWNDAILLIEVGGIRLLNLNDAGLNHRIAKYVAPVDIVASAFSEGASGYPLTWTHLSEEEKAAIIARSRKGTLAMLRAACRLYEAERLLPFAGYFTLWHPAHRAYVQQMQPNSLDDVHQALAGTGIEVIDILPGERYDVDRRRISRRWNDRESLIDKERVLGYAERAYEPRLFAQAHPEDRELSREALETYLLRLNEVPEIAFCEDVAFSLRATDLGFKREYLRVDAVIRDGSLRILDAPLAAPELVMELPRSVIAAIVYDGESWDEAHIGYWCRFQRSPDIYHAGLWRLLQAPYYRTGGESLRSDGGAITRTSVIAEVLERLGEPADRILRRHGLFCVGCAHSAADTLYRGGLAHGLDDQRIDRLTAELALLDAARW